MNVDSKFSSQDETENHTSITIKIIIIIVKKKKITIKIIIIIIVKKIKKYNNNYKTINMVCFLLLYLEYCSFSSILPRI